MGTLHPLDPAVPGELASDTPGDTEAGNPCHMDSSSRSMWRLRPTPCIPTDEGHPDHWLAHKPLGPRRLLFLSPLGSGQTWGRVPSVLDHWVFLSTASSGKVETMIRGQDSPSFCPRGTTGQASWIWAGCRDGLRPSLTSPSIQVHGTEKKSSVHYLFTFTVGSSFLRDSSWQWTHE